MIEIWLDFEVNLRRGVYSCVALTLVALDKLIVFH